MSRLKEQYQNEIVDAMIKKFGYKNIMEVPKLDKVVINMGVGEAKDNAKLLDAAIADMEKITGQKAVVCKAKKSVANFKIREGMPIGCKVTLRGEKMYEFVDRLVNLALPRVRDFRGVNPNAFDGRGNYALYNLNLEIKDNVILVGRNGSGKSTLIKILAGLYDDYEGKIFVNGINLKKIKKSSLQKNMSILFQDYNKYEMTVRDNIALGDLFNIKDSDILEALKRTKSPFSNSDGLDQQLGVWFKDGQQISGGEWLKIGLCKVLIKKSDFYILDEPNAALDAVSEKEILDYIIYAKEKGCSMTGPEDAQIEYLNVLK